MSKTYRLFTLGCKLNQQESESLASGLRALGFVPARKGEEADVCLINSCTVTSMADSKTRQRIRQARKGNPEAFVCVVGCLAETSREALLAMPEVDACIGSLEKDRAPEIVLEALKANDSDAAGTAASPDLSGRLLKNIIRMPAKGAESEESSRTRAFIKVEDGCDRFCAYCIVPYARGAVRSRPAGEVLAEAGELLRAGYKELVLTGVNLALYGKDSIGCSAPGPAESLYSLAKQICGLKAPEEFRVRLGSLEPTVVGAEEAARIANIKGVCPQFHLSLQSGCEKTLMEMGRPYTPEAYAETVRALRAIDPLFSITTDVIVGFPGESEADFNESLDFVKSMGFAHVHVFKYSKRPGTRASEMAGHIKEEVKNERSRLMIEAAEESAARFLAMNKGKTRRTLIFGPDKSGRYIRGLTDNGIDVMLPKSDGVYMPNDIIDIKL